MFPAAESSWSDRAPQNIYHPPLSPPPSVLNHGPPILSLCLALALCLALFGSVPHSLSPPSFSLTVSPVRLTIESSLADAFSPTCPYLQKKARGGKKKKNNSVLWIWPLYHSSLFSFLFAAVHWLPSGFPHGIRMTTAAFFLPPAALHHFCLQLFARRYNSCVQYEDVALLEGWVDLTTFNQSHVSGEKDQRQLRECASGRL